MKLYEISAEAQAIEILLTESEGEVTPELEQRMKEFVEGGAEKLESAAAVLRSLQAQSDACEAEAKRLKARSASLGANSDRLKALMAAAVDAAFKGKLKTPLFTIYTQQSPTTVIFALAPDADLLQLPEDLVKYEAPKLETGVLYDKWRSKQDIPTEIVVTETPGKRGLRLR